MIYIDFEVFYYQKIRGSKIWMGFISMNISMCISISVHYYIIVYVAYVLLVFRMIYEQFRMPFKS